MASAAFSAADICVEGVSPPGRRFTVLATMFVATGPGHSTLTPMLCWASSRCSDSDSPTTAYFDVVYKKPEPASTRPAPDAVLTM